MKKIIVSFHIGKGGRFFNPGFKTFIGERKISEFTDDLFIVFENQYKLCSLIENHENLRERYDYCCDSNDFSFFKRKFNFDIGEEIFVDNCGSPVGLTKKEHDTGIGKIEIDGSYNTTYSCYLEDCSEEEIELIKKSDYWNNEYLVEEFQRITK